MSIAMLSLLAFMLLAVITLVYGTHIVGPETADASFSLYVAVPILITVLTISGGLLLGYYIFLVVAIVASLAWFALSGYKGFKKEITMTAKSREHSPIFDVCGLLFAVLFFNAITVIVVEILGGTIEGAGEENELWEMLFLLANASVWEELVTRVLLIGLPLVMVHYYTGRIRRQRRSYVLGGGFTIGPPETALILVSSLVFGLAHFAGGWGEWKVIPATVAGLAFGYLFLKHGLTSAIVLHFSFDYMQMPMAVFGGVSFEILTAVAVLFWLSLGIIMFTYYVTRVVEFLTGTKMLEPAPRPTPYSWMYPGMQQPSPWQQQTPVSGQQTGWAYQPPAPQLPQAVGWGFMCPICGYTEARWEEGRFRCLRCGNQSP